MSTEKLSELSKPVAEIVSKFGDPEAFGEREIKLLTGIQQMAYGTKFYSQEYVSALLEDNERVARDLVARNGEIEGLRKRAAELEAKNAQLKKELHNEGAANANAYERIRELEKRLATPVRLLGEMLLHDWEHRVERQATFQHRKIAWDARLAEDKKAILAAGFTFIVEGDE